MGSMATPVRLFCDCLVIFHGYHAPTSEVAIGLNKNFLTTIRLFV